MSTKNTYSTSQMRRDLERLKTSINNAASKALSRTVDKAKSFELSFDEAEIVPYSARASAQVVVSSSSSNVAELSENVDAMLNSLVSDYNENFLDCLQEELK